MVNTFFLQLNALTGPRLLRFIVARRFDGVSCFRSRSSPKLASGIGSTGGDLCSAPQGVLRFSRGGSPPFAFRCRVSFFLVLLSYFYAPLFSRVLAWGGISSTWRQVTNQWNISLLPETFFLGVARPTVHPFCHGFCWPSLPALLVALS